MYIPYSGKFSRDKIFTDQPLTNFCGNKFRGSRIPVTHAQHYLLTVAATPCSAARFALLVELRLGPSWFVRLSSSTTRLKLETPPNWQTQLVPSKKLTMAAPQESGSVRFETTTECHVALDVHAILQKWNIYHFVSTLYHGLPGNLPKSFEELNFRGAGRIRENRENYAPRKFGAIRYESR